YVDDIVLTTSLETFLQQRKYVFAILERAHMVNCNSSRTLVDTKSKLKNDVQHVCLYMHDPREPHLATLKRILRYVRGTLDYGLKLFSSSTTYLVAYSDADWAGCPTTRRSTSEAEYRGVANVAAETYWLRNLLLQHVCLYMHDPREPHLATLKRILWYVRGTLDYGLKLFSSSTTDLVAYSDADWAGCPTTRRSTSGYCVFLGNNLLSWSSKRQLTLSRSSAEAEYRGVANAAAETCWL
nr:ribonuclease H-like domain-containing protein [Tanacetum cinerariifolium]